MKRFLSFFIIFGILICSFPQIHVYAEKEQAPFNVDAKSAVLMEATTGTILFAQNESDIEPIREEQTPEYQERIRKEYEEERKRFALNSRGGSKKPLRLKYVLHKIVGAIPRSHSD